MKPGTIVEVAWEDAAHQARWDTADAFPTTVQARTVGFFIDQDEHRFILAAESIEEHYRDVTVIPIGMVRKVRRLG